MSKFEPKNKEEAFTYQWEDDVRHLRSLALLSEKEFQAYLKIFKQHIESYSHLLNAVKTSPSFNRIEYLESLLPEGKAGKNLQKKYEKNFQAAAVYLGNGTYGWKGLYSTDTRELFLMGVLSSENISYNLEGK